MLWLNSRPATLLCALGSRSSPLDPILSCVHFSSQMDALLNWVFIVYLGIKWSSNAFQSTMAPFFLFVEISGVLWFCDIMAQYITLMTSCGSCPLNCSELSLSSSIGVQTCTIMLVWKFPWRGTGNWLLRNVCVGMCRWDPGTLCLYQTQFSWILLLFGRLNFQSLSLS